MSTRPEASDPHRYSREAWEETRREALAEHVDGPPPATLAPGIVAMSLRGDPADVEHLVTFMRAMGIVAWKANSPGTSAGNSAGYQYYSVEVPKDSRG